MLLSPTGSALVGLVFKTPIRVLTLRQPYASLVALNLKQWETRPETITWDSYRGLIAIHAASKSFVKSYEDTMELLSDEEGLPPELAAFSKTAHQLPLSQILCVSRLINSQIMTKDLIKKQTRLERCVGGWATGQKAIALEDTVSLIDPIPFAGMQGLTQIKNLSLADHLINSWKAKFTLDPNPTVQLNLW